MLVDILSKIYVFSGSIVIFMYLFQIWKVYKDKTPSHSISLISWGTWCITSFISMVYIATHAHDLKLFMFALGEHLCMVAITLLTIRNRVRHK